MIQQEQQQEEEEEEEKEEEEEEEEGENVLSITYGFAIGKKASPCFTTVPQRGRTYFMQYLWSVGAFLDAVCNGGLTPLD